MVKARYIMPRPRHSVLTVNLVRFFGFKIFGFSKVEQPIVCSEKQKQTYSVLIFRLYQKNRTSQTTDAPNNPSPSSRASPPAAAAPAAPSFPVAQSHIPTPR
jgi:hypothetical protein